ncbi:2-oxoacid:acceptor oxidoreductase subunit alpha [Candidatus Bathyarchaeota archaeon]|nr:2-oxoacid:acceptor oxidoreductase subunit alpha [Candidatus Bathyarchaeota archaeon]
MRCSGLVDDTVTVLIGGEAGQGISRSGMLLGKAMMRGGFYSYGAIDYPSLIRGGHNFYTVRGSSRKVYANSGKLDLVVALNRESVFRHMDEINPGGGIIYDEKEAISDEELSRKDINFYPVPLSDVVKELGGPSIMRNTVALGSVSALVGLDVNILNELISETFEGRDKIISMNVEAIQKGWESVIEFNYGFKCTIEAGGRKERLWLTGNEAVALGAQAAGCNFFAAYPMTPASAVLHYYAGHDEETDSVVVQTESEIAAMCMIVGASYAGVRAMTSTSGGGFCLMTEALSMAAIQENPVVIMLGQRPGPSTGLATYSAQGDLLFAVFGAHGEFQRIVLAPGDAEECFYLTTEAFNLAERFQIPVIILPDKEIIESHETVEVFDVSKVDIIRGSLLREWEGGEYLRFKFTENGVSPRVIPGTPNAMVLANSNEHTERGFGTSVSEAARLMVDKRFRKGEHIRRATSKLSPIKSYGSDDPEITMVGWGSTKGPALETIGLLSGQGVKARYVQIRIMEPFPDGLMEYLSGETVLFENNRTASLGTLIKLNTGYKFENMGLRYDGRSLTPNEMVSKVMEVLG